MNYLLHKPIKIVILIITRWVSILNPVRIIETWVSSQHTLEETSVINRQLSAVTLMSPSLPFDLVEEILARLPVKSLLQFRCVCKSWNSLITDNPEFAKKHLRFSKTNHRLVLNAVSHSKNTPRKYLVKSYPIESPFTTTNPTQFHYPPNSYDDGEFPLLNLFRPVIGSCDGILCLNGNHNKDVLILWNPSIGKSRELPPLEKLSKFSSIGTIFCGFGYDSLSDNYKVVAVYDYLIHDTRTGYWIPETQVRVHSLGTNSWRKIQAFPYSPTGQSPKYFCGKIHWMTYIHGSTDAFPIIVSLDLGNESYQEVMQPDYVEEIGLHHLRHLIIGVLNDCLSMLTHTSVWVMKEYGNKESWTKIFSFRHMEAYEITQAIYIFEDDQILLQARRIKDSKLKMVVSDSKNGIINFHRMDNTPELMVESLISP